MIATRTAAIATMAPTTIPPIAPPESDVAVGIDELCEDASAVEVDVGAIVVTMTCVVGVTDETVYTVDMTLDSEGWAGGGGGGGGGGSWPSRICVNDGGTMSTVAHFAVNQSEVVSRSSELQLCAKQGTAFIKNPCPLPQIHVHYQLDDNCCGSMPQW